MAMAARVGDMHLCPQVTPGTPPVPHLGGAIQGPGCATVRIGGRPAARMGDMATCTGPPDPISAGCTTVLFGGRAAARVGDATSHGGAITSGCSTVVIGGNTAGGGAVSAAMAVAGGAGGAASVEPVPDEHTGPVESEASPPEPTWIGIILRDPQDVPLADQPFEVTLEGGQVLGGTTDEEGHCRFDDLEPDQGEVAFARFPDSETASTRAGTEPAWTVTLQDPPPAPEPSPQEEELPDDFEGVIP